MYLPRLAGSFYNTQNTSCNKIHAAEYQTYLSSQTTNTIERQEPLNGPSIGNSGVKRLQKHLRSFAKMGSRKKTKKPLTRKKPEKPLTRKERRADLPANLRRVRREALFEARKAVETPEERGIREARQIRRANKPAVLERRASRAARREEKDQVLKAKVQLSEDWVLHAQQFPANKDFTPERALAYIESLPSTPTRKTYWCDGSAKKHAAMGVAYKDNSGEWVKLSWRVQNPPIMQEELFKASSIAKALEIAREDYDLLVEKPCQVVIFSDSPTALNYFANRGDDPRFYDAVLMEPGYKAARELEERGIQVELRYVPILRGQCIAGNRQARQAANWGWRPALKVLDDNGLVPLVHRYKGKHEGRGAAAC